MEAENLKGMKQEEAKVEECDKGDIYDILDIMVEDVVRLGQLHTPSIHTLPELDPMVQPCSDVMDDVIHPSIHQVIHTTPPDKDYVAPATKSILDELLEEFRDKILNITMVDEKADCNPTKDIEELERLIAKDPRSYFTEIKVHSLIIKTNEEFEPFIHTQPLSPLYGAFKSSKSSTKPC
ncbi:hypothetical protein Tco_0923912 [Tanacetum coccineum]|uniref:Uncharacterized protein n=1 Tax=Tanacetum coccineum TaxID=301880 RepID=A0ABQ5D5H7_9ASTR